MAFSFLNLVLDFSARKLFIKHATLLAAFTLLFLPAGLSASVTQNGTYTYQIPVTLPPGLENMVPQELGLVYSNTGGMNMAGVGWHLAGIPMVTRAKGMTYTTADRFTVAGAELVDTIGNRSVFYSESDPLTQYIPVYGECGLAPTEPCAWEAHSPNGSIMYFGTTPMSRAEAAGKNAYRTWALEKVQNAAGLYYTIEYTESGGELYPTRIIYTYGPHTSRYKRIYFNYQDSNQSPLLYTHGAPTRLTKLLSGIDVAIDYTCFDIFLYPVCFGGNNFRSYRFQYTAGSGTGKTLMSGFTEQDENGNILPASATFTYQDNNLVPQHRLWGVDTVIHMRNAGGTSRDYVSISGDFNGDGLTDVATVHQTHVPDLWSAHAALEISTGSGFRSEAWTSGAVQRMYQSGGGFGNYAVIPGDFNGDGKTDIAIFRRSATGPGDFWYSSFVIDYSTGNGFHTVYQSSVLGAHMYNGGGFTPSYLLMPADVNGDGITDVIALSRSTDGVNIWASNCIVIKGAGSNTVSTGAWPAATAQRIFHGGGALDDYRVLAGDFDGDGKTDLVVGRKASGPGDTWATGFSVELSRENGFSSQFWHTPTASAIQQSDGQIGDFALLSGDFNGDGKIDIATIRHPTVCRDDICVRAASPPTSEPWYNGFYVDLSTGSGFASGFWPASSPAHLWAGEGKISDYRFIISDLNRDGISDILIAHGSNVAAIWSTHFLTETSNGSSFLSGTRLAATASYLSGSIGNNAPNYNILSGDFNGDALPDLLMLAPYSLGCVCVSVEMSAGALPDQMVSNQSLLGFREEITYRLSTQISNAIKPRTGVVASYPYPVASVPQNLVERNRILADGKVQRDTSYAYDDGTVFLNDAGRHKSLGFARIRETDNLSGKYKITHYFRAPSFSGQPSRIDAFLGDNTWFMSEEFDPPEIFPSGDLAWYDKNPWPRHMRQRRYLRRTADGPLQMTYERRVRTFDDEHRPTVVEEYVNGKATTTFLTYAATVLHTVATKKVCNGDFNYSLENCYPGYSTPIQDSMDNLGIERSAYLTPLSLNLGRPTNTSRYLGKIHGVARWLMTEYQYDADTGQVVAEISRNNYASIRYTYDEYFGQFPRTRTEYGARPPSESPGPAVITYTTYDPRFGKLIYSQDERGMHTVLGLDTRGRETERIVYDNHGSMIRRSTVAYDEQVGGMTAESCQFYGNNLSQKVCSRVVTDSLGRELIKVLPTATGPENAATFSAVKTEYDSLWRKARVSLPYAADAQGNGTPERWIVYSYDARDRVVKVTQPNGDQSLTRHNDFNFTDCANTIADPCVLPEGTTHRISEINAAGQRKDTYSDHLGKPVRIVDAVGTPEQSIIDYAYYGNGKLKKVTAPQGVTEIYYYPGSWLRSAISDPNAGMTVFWYDWNGSGFGDPAGTGAFGKLVQETGSRHVNYEYDAWGRMKLKQQTGETGIETTGFEYDEEELSYGKGRLTAVRQAQAFSGAFLEGRRHDAHLNHSGITKKMAYDIAGNVTGLITDIHMGNAGVDTGALPQHSVTVNEYDNLGRKTAVVYGDLTRSEFRYAGATGLISEIRHADAVFAKYSDYTLAGQAQKIVYGNGVRGTYSFDAETLLLDNLVVKDAADRPIQNLDYAFDDAGNVESITDNVVSAASYAYTYDGLNRLKSAARGDGRIFNYAFDGAGNLTAKEGRQNQFVPGSTRLLTSLIAGAGHEAQQVTEFTYSPSGALQQKNTAQKSTRYHYTGASMLAYAEETGGVLGGTAVHMVYDEGGIRYLKRFLPKCSSMPGCVATAENPEIRTFSLGGLEIREKWADNRRIELQKLRYVFGPGGERLAMVAASVTPDALALGATSPYRFARASMTSGDTLAGRASGIQNLFIGVYLAAAEYYIVWHKEILLVTLVLAALLFVLLARSYGQDIRQWRISVATLTLVGFVSVNCSSGHSPLHHPAYTPPGTGAVPWDPLLSGIPEGTYYYHQNHLQSAVLITNGAGLEEMRVHYLPYGDIDQNLSGKWNAELGVLEHRQSDAVVGSVAARYTDQTLDIETSLMYYNARYYDPQLGVFTTPDTVVPDGGYSQNYNRYMYVRGNPIRYNDPTGHCEILCAVLIGAAVGGAIGGFAAGIEGDFAGWLSGSKQFNWDAAWKGAIAGALAGAAGAYVGVAVVGALPATTATLDLMVAVGATAGYTSGFVGGASGAWLNGAEFMDGIGAGILGGTIGMFAGIVLAVAGYGLSRLGGAASSSGSGADSFGDMDAALPPDETAYYPPGTVNKRGYKAHTGKVKFVPSRGAKMSYSKIRVVQGDHKYSALDIAQQHSDDGAWLGPNQRFRVIQARAHAPWQTGSELRIQFEDGNQLFFGHLTEMNAELKLMAGKDYWFPARTFLGRTTGNIGFMNGLHLHVEGWRGGINGDYLNTSEIYNYLR